MTVETHVVEWAGTFVDDVFNDMQSKVIDAVIDAITPYAAWFVAIYLIGIFLLVAIGKTEQVKEGLWILMKISVISAIALNASYLETYLLSPINGFLSIVSNAVSGSDGVSLYAIADTAINKSTAVADQAWEKAGEAGWGDWWISLMWIIAGLVASAGGLLMVGPCVIAIIAARAIISLMFMISPIFVFAAIFPFTAKYFLNWTAAVGNAVWVIILAALIMPLSTTMTSGLMDSMDVSNGMAGPWTVINMTVFVAILFWVIIFLIFNLASTLAGGLSMSMPVTSSMVGRGARAATAAPFRWLGSKVPFNRRGGSVASN